MSPGRPAAGRTRCRRPSGWVTVPSFSAWVSSGKRTSALAAVAVAKVEKETTKLGGVQRLLPGRGVGEVAERVDADQDQRRRAHRRSAPGGSPRCRGRGRRAPPGPGRRRAGRPPRAGRARWSCRAFRSRPAPSVVGHRRSARRRARAARCVRRGADPLAPDDDDLAGVAQRLGQRRRDVLARRRPPRSARRRSRRPGRARSGRSPRRRRRARSAARSRPRGARRCGGSPCGSAGRGSARTASGRCRAPGSRRPRRCRRPSPGARAGPGRGSCRSPGRPPGASRCAASGGRRGGSPGSGSPPRWRRRRRSPRPCRRAPSGPRPLSRSRPRRRPCCRLWSAAR